VSITDDALVAVCLCTRLGRGASVRPLAVREWTDLVLALHRVRQAAPHDLLEKNAAQLAAEYGIEVDVATRVEELLRGLASVGMEVERLNSGGVWVMTRGDEDYPRFWKRRLGASAPPVLFGAGPRAALSADLLAVVGASGALARDLSELCTRDGWGVVSGGVDATLSAGGFGVEVLTGSLERTIAKKSKREAILDGRLTLLAPDESQERNRLVCALARYACTLEANTAEAGTPVLARVGDDATIPEGATPIPSPLPDSLQELFAACDQPIIRDRGQAEFEL